MRRDIFKYFNSDVKIVFNGYLQSAERYYPRKVTAERYHTIDVALHSSMRYNINGGALHMHFIRYNSGTAVELRYTLVQITLARYNAHEYTISTEAEKYIRERGMTLNGVTPELFQDSRLMVSAGPDDIPDMPPFGASFAPPAPGAAGVPGAQGQRQARFCPQCGFELYPNAVFCSGCGFRMR